jgi:hypothetical protein
MMNTRHSKRLTAAAAVLLLVAVACNPFSDAAALRPMTVEPDGPGSVFVRRAGEEIEVTGRFSLAKGDVIRTSSAGARIILESDRSASVAKNSRVHVTGGGSLEVIGGSVLAEAGRHMTLAVDDVTATTSDGLLRVDRYSASAGVAGYAGKVVIAAPGQEKVTLDPLFDVSVAAGQVLEPRPYHVEMDDKWDRLYLSEVVELDEQLERYAGAMSGQLRRAQLRRSYFRTLGGGDAARAMTRYVDSPAYSAPDLLIGFSIADLDEATPQRRSLDTAFDHRRDGGQWGVIATIMGVESGPLIAGLEDLIFAAGAVASAPGGTDTSSNGPASGGTSNARPGRGSGGSTGGGGSNGTDGGSGPESEGPSDGSGDSGDTDGDGGESSSPPEEDCDNLIDCVIGILPLDVGVLP